MVAGRHNESRTASVTTTSGSAAVTAGAGTFNEEDAGRTITGTGIPAGTTVATVTSDTAVTLSANATASGTVTATLGADSTGQGYGFRGWSPESDAESETYTVSAVNAGTAYPGQLTDDRTSAHDRRTRS